jgi:Tfp pilus assembly protein PilW
MADKAGVVIGLLIISGIIGIFLIARKEPTLLPGRTAIVINWQ